MAPSAGRWVLGGGWAPGCARMTLHSTRLDSATSAMKLENLLQTSQEASGISNCWCLCGRTELQLSYTLLLVCSLFAPCELPVQCISLYCAFVLWQRSEGQNSMNVFLSSLMHYKNILPAFKEIE